MDGVSQVSITITNICDNQLVRKITVLAPFQKFNSMTAFRLVLWKHIMAEVCGRTKPLTSQAGSKSQQGETRSEIHNYTHTINILTKMCQMFWDHRRARICRSQGSFVGNEASALKIMDKAPSYSTNMFLNFFKLMS